MESPYRFDPPPPFPEGMTWDQFQARARAEGIWDDALKASVFAGMVGIDAALADFSLPAWAQAALRSQFPSRH